SVWNTACGCRDEPRVLIVVIGTASCMPRSYEAATGAFMRMTETRGDRVPYPTGLSRVTTKRPRFYGGPMASVKKFQVTCDCAEPERGARFWCEVLGYVVPPPPEGFATWEDYDRSLPA